MSENLVFTGWNDPPSNIANGARVGNRLQRHRRPVDPSVQVDGGTTDGFSQGIQNHMTAPPPNHHSFSSPPSFNNLNTACYPQNAPVLPPSDLVHQIQQAAIPLGTHPASAFTPTVPSNSHGGNGTSFISNFQNVHGGGIMRNQSNPSISSSADLHTAQQQHQFSNMSQTPQIQQQHLQQQLPTQAPTLNNFTNYDHNNLVTSSVGQPPAFSTNNTGFADKKDPQALSSQNLQLAMMMPVRNYEGDPSSLIFSPPNTINFDQLQQRRLVTMPDMSTYVPPTKAAGDVSLSGSQLVAFLTKATLRLPEGTIREGVQLRLAQLSDLITAAQVSDTLIKKLNFVVDAIDREIYDEAWQFFEQMQSTFPNEMASSWAHGIKILIIELRKATSAL